MTLLCSPRRLVADSSGATIVEFALLAPAFIVMLLGVMQVGIGLQNYNALRNVSADVARHAMVEYARGNELNNDELETYAKSAGDGAPYLLTGNRLTVDVATVDAPRVTGATELTLSMTYTIPSVISSMGLEGPTIEFSRPIFLATS